MQIKGKIYGTSNLITLPCGVGNLTEIANVTAGNFTDSNGIVWTKSVTTSGTRYFITLSGSGAYAISNFGYFDNVMTAAGFHIKEWKYKLHEYLTTGTTKIIPQSQGTELPNYKFNMVEGGTGTFDPNIESLEFKLDTGISGDVEDGGYEYRQAPGHSYEYYSNGCPVVFKTTSGLGDYVFGWMYAKYGVGSTSGVKQLHVFVNTALNIHNFFPLKKGAGDEGFIPTKSGSFISIGGGEDSGTPTYESDPLTMPDAPDESVASAAGSGLLHAYKITAENLSHLAYNLFSPTWQSKFTHLFWEPLDSIISLQVFPCEPDVGSSEYVKCLSYMNKTTADGLRDSWENSQAAPLSKQFKQFDFGSVSVPEMFGSFLDYDASSFELFLPFIGDISLPVNEVMGSTVSVAYTVDFFTGMCVANVLIEKSALLGSGESVDQYAQHSYMGNCAVQIPLTSVQYGNIMGSLAQAASIGLKTGIAGAAGSLASSAAGGGFRPTVQTKGTIGANAGFCGILYPYLTITRPITAEPDSYQQVVGYPSYVDGTLANMNGFCKVDDIDLTNVSGMTESEARRVKSMCQEGIYI